MPKRKAETLDGVLAPAGGDPLFAPGEAAGGSEKKSRLRITIPLTEDGREIDDSAFRAASQERLRAVLEADPKALNKYGPAGEGMVAGQVGPVNEWHINLLLNLDETVKKWAFPAYVKQQSQGKVIIPSAIADRAFSFSADQREKLIPLWIKFLNESLPPWALAWLGKMGPGAEAVGLYLMISWMQCRMCLELTKEEFGRGAAPVPIDGQPQPVNGHAKTDVA